jgi:WD40 repeat protein
MPYPGEGAIACWDLKQGKHWLLPGHDGAPVLDVAINSVGDLIAACRGPRTGPWSVKLWNVNTCGLIAELPTEDTFIGNVALSPAGDRLAVASTDQMRLSVWTNLTSRPQVLWSVETTLPYTVAFAPHGDVLAVGCFIQLGEKESLPAVVIFDAHTGRQLDVASLDRAVVDVAFSPDGRLLASIDWQGKVEVCDTHERRNVLSESAHRWIGKSVAFSPDGRTLATASTGQIQLWHIPTMMHITTLETHHSVSDAVFLPDQQTLAIVYADRTIELWHVDRDKRVLRIDGVMSE